MHTNNARQGKTLPTPFDRLKLLKHILRGTIWSLVVLYVAFTLLSHIPSVQRFAGSYVADLLSETLGTEVKIGRVDLGFLNRIIIDDVTIYDREQVEMLSVGRLSAKFDLSLLSRGIFSVSSVQLFGAKAQLYRADEASEPNFQFIVDILSNPNDTTKSNTLGLRINSLIIRNTNVSFNQKDKPLKKAFDTHHLNFSDISAHIILKYISADSLNLRVRRLSLRERSGLEVSNLSFRTAVGSQKAVLHDFALELPGSQFSVNELEATYPSGKAYDAIIAPVHLNASATLNDFAFLLPELMQFDEQLDLEMVAERDEMRTKVTDLSIASATNLLSFLGEGWIQSAGDSISLWHAQIGTLSLSRRGIALLTQLTHTDAPFLDRLGTVILSGQYRGNDDIMLGAVTNISTDIGDVELKLDYFRNQTFRAHISTDSLLLDRMMDEPQLGRIASKVDVVGNSRHIHATGSIPKFCVKGYDYRNVTIDGTYDTDNIFKSNQRARAKGLLTIDDKNLRAVIDGELQKRGRQLSLRLSSDVGKIYPQRLHLSDKWGDVLFCLLLDSDIKATDLNDAVGTINLHKLYMADSLSSYSIKDVALRSGFEGSQHFLSFEGEMGTGLLRGEFDLNTMPQSFINYVATILPTLPGLPKTTLDVDNNFNLDLQLNDTEWLRRIVGIPLTIHSPFSLHMSINDLEHQIAVDGTLPSFTYDGAYYSDAKALLTSPDDSLKCDVSVVKRMDDGSEMLVSLNANAHDNRFQTSFSWDNLSTADRVAGNLNTVTSLYTADDGNAEAHVRVLASHAIIDTVRWDIVPCDIYYKKENLVVDNFSIRNDLQHLNINGRASTLDDDTLTVEMKEVDVSYVLDLINFHPVDFDGFATGTARVSQLFGVPHAWADLVVRQFTFEGGRFGTLNAHASWNNEEEQIDIRALADDGPNAKTFINGYVSPVREDIDLQIEAQGTYVDFLQNYTTSFLTNVTGNGWGSLRLVGPLGEMDLLGDIVVDGRAHVIPLGTDYTLRKDTVRLVRNDILLRRAQVFDRYDNVAYLWGGIHHDHLSRLTFDLEIETTRFLAYDFPTLGDDSFCGTVLASGFVDMHGRPGEVTINCNATPLQSTTFTYNAAQTDVVTNQDFITWRDKATIADTTGNAAIPHSVATAYNNATDIYLNFIIDATPQSTLRLLMDSRTGDYITFNGSGALRASYHNKGAFQLFGTYSIVRGTYGITIQDIIKKNFQFKEGGTIVFGGNPMNASLQLQAIHTVNGVSLSDLNIGNSFSNNSIRVNCLMNIGGQARSPRVEFDLDFPNINNEEKQMVRSIIASEQEMNQQVLYLLGIGRFYTQGVNNAGTEQEYGQTQLAMQSFLSGTLSSQISNVISKFIKNDDWNFGANISTGNEGWNNAEYEGIVSGRMLNNRLILNGQFGYRDNARQASPSFIGDFDLRYLLQPNGNLALRVYNQTNDRYFTHSSLNTQGLGLIIKRDFNGLGDFFSRKRKK